MEKEEKCKEQQNERVGEERESNVLSKKVGGNKELCMGGRTGRRLMKDADAL